MYIDAEEKKELMAHNTMSGGMFKWMMILDYQLGNSFENKLGWITTFYNVLKDDALGNAPTNQRWIWALYSWTKTALESQNQVTGLWQISGRSSITDFDEVVKLDVAYIDGWILVRHQNLTQNN